MKKKSLKFIFSYAFGAIFILGLILGLNYQEQLQRRAFNFLAEQIEQQTGYHLECTGMRFTFPLHWHVDTLTLSSTEGPVLQIEDFNAHINLWEWLHKNAVLDAIQMNKLVIHHIPDTNSPQELSWENIPLYCNIHRFSIDELYLKSSQTPLKIVASGVCNPERRDIFVDMSLQNAQKNSRQTHVIASFSQPFQEELILHLRIVDESGGLLSEYFSLPSGYNHQVILEMSGTKTSWKKLSHATLDGLFGDVQLSYTADGDNKTQLLGNYGSLKSPFVLSEGQMEFSDIEGLIGPAFIKGMCHLNPDGECRNAKFQLSFDHSQENPIKFDLSGNLYKPNIALKINTDTLHLGSHQISNLEAHATIVREGNSIGTTANIVGKCEGHDCEIAATSTWNFSTSLLDISMDSMNGSLDKFPFALQNPAHFILEPQRCDLSPLSLSIGNPLTPLQGNVFANLIGNNLNCTAKLLVMGLQPVLIQGSIPMNISVSPLYISVDTKNPCKARLTADGKIESLFEFLLPVSTTNLAGNSTISLDLSGTLEQPQVTGQIRINNGTFELIGVGGSAHHVNAVVDIKNMHEAAVQLSAQGNGGGTITGHGTADLSLQPLLPFDLSFQLHQIPLQPSSYAHVIASGDLRLKGDFEKGILEGKLVSDSVSVSIPEHIPELAHTIDVTYVNHQTHRPLPTACRTPAIPGWPLAYNLEFEIPRHCMLRGQDWTSEWKGNAILTGTNEKLLLNGSCKVIRGEYRFNGQVFDIKEGTITFAGSPKKTSLYVIAGKDIETMHVEVIAKGLVSEPAIVFRSNPPMSQREILSWILFNRGTSEISTFQGTQLNESITSLNRGNNRSDVLTKIRDRIGIDKIDICRSRDADSNAVSVQLGKYITRGVLLSIHKSITDEVNRVSVEADLMKNVKIQAQVGDDAAGQMTLKWKRDY